MPRDILVRMYHKVKLDNLQLRVLFFALILFHLLQINDAIKFSLIDTLIFHNFFTIDSNNLRAFCIVILKPSCQMIFPIDNSYPRSVMKV